jgi:6-pyruvoyltetrahydropterin/6-carboxytetrahydropterin synthase|tara:strand:+ start:120 stop:494 length:375 start_codon:yes stop_codon:yes gene_type:complete
VPFELRIERTFSAAHAIVIQGEREPLHGHDWRVLVAVRGPQLDQEELLCDFHAIEQQVDGVIAPFHNANLNETTPFDQRNPTAEAIAEHLHQTLMDRMPRGASLHRVEIGEAPGCTAVYGVKLD